MSCWHFFNNGFEQGAPTGLTALDNFITFETKRLCVVTGVPGQGKSEFVDEMVLRLCLHHSWKIGYFSPENVPLVYHLRKLFEKVSGKRFSPQCTGPELYRRVQNFMGNNVCHIIPKADFCVDTVLEKARQLVRRKGIRILVIDPYNRMEHQIPPGMSETQYIDNFLDKLTNFAVLNDCLVILVAHPRKMNRDARTGSPDRPTLYDINGSAAFFNKCDFGLVVERMPDVVHIYVEKVKFRNLGQPGMVPLVFNPTNGRYSLCDEDPTAGSPEMSVTNVKFNTDCWLPKEEDQELFWEGNE
jgi:twinkle protein